jgi:predicted  nucleic acid-binding Zn-ribbon protein
MSWHWPWNQSQFEKDATALLVAIKATLIDVKGGLTTINNTQAALLQEVKKVDATAQKLSDDLTALQTALTTGLNDLSAEIAALKAQVAAGVPATDEELSALDEKVTAMTAAVAAVDPGPQTAQ